MKKIITMVLGLCLAFTMLMAGPASATGDHPSQDLRCDVISADYHRGLVNGDHINMEIKSADSSKYQVNAYVDRNLGGYDDLGLRFSNGTTKKLTKAEVKSGVITFNYGELVKSRPYTVTFVQTNSNDTWPNLECGTPPSDDKVELCHATHSNTNPFVLKEVSAEGAYNGHLGEGHQDGEDIIPPFVYEGNTYSQNWNTEGQAIFNNGCEPVDVPEEFVPYEVDVCWTMENSDGVENTYEFPQTRGCAPPKCEETVEQQHDTYWIRDEDDEAYLDGLNTLNSPADDASLEPHDYYSEILEGEKCVTPPVEPPVTPPTPEPPVCDDECDMPFVPTKAKKVTVCAGVLSGKVLRNVRVPAGASCTLVDTYVNGSVRSNGGHDLYLADANVRGNINVRNMTGDVVFGSKGRACRYDPYVGGSIIVKRSHNVLVCQASVCDSIVVQRNDGRITISNSTARRVVVRGNKRFDADGPEVHPRESRIRLLDVDARKFVIKNNSPREVVRR